MFYNNYAQKKGEDEGVASPPAIDPLNEKKTNEEIRERM